MVRAVYLSQDSVEEVYKLLKAMREAEATWDNHGKPARE